MILGIMQPYFFPYIGYWQLIYAVDKYVIYDDVNFIKGGWINRNRILNNGAVQYINIRLMGASSFKHINQINVNQERVIIEKTKKTLWNAYHRAEQFETIYPLITNVLECGICNLANYLEYSIRKVCDYLEIDTEIFLSSQIKKNDTLKGKDKIIDICKKFDAYAYYNAIGGSELYNFDEFKDEGITLAFLKARDIEYKQLKEGKFEPNLSIIDVMMNNSKEEVRKMLSLFDLKTN